MAKTLTGVQVEHPVTEWISGVNIPSCQLMIGMGIRLDRMADIRRLFGKDPEGSGAIGMAYVTFIYDVHLYRFSNNKRYKLYSKRRIL